MITILSFLTKISIILGLGATIFTSISDLVLKTTYLDQFDDFINLGSPRVKIVLALLAIAYLIIFILSFINRLTKYSQNRKIKNKNGEIEVSIKTINEVTKDFLGNKDIIKNSRIKSYPSGKSVVIEAVVETYNVDNLSEKLSKIQEGLSEYVFKYTGISVKRSKIKLKKVLGETIIEKTIIKEPETKLNGKISGVVSNSKPEVTDVTPSETITNEVEKIKDNAEKSEGKN